MERNKITIAILVSTYALVIAAISISSNYTFPTGSLNPPNSDSKCLSPPGLSFTKYFFWDVPDEWPEGVYPLCDEPIDVYYLNCTSHWVLVDTIYTQEGLITVTGVPGWYRFEWIGVGDCEWKSISYLVTCATTELPDNEVQCPKTFTKRFYWAVPADWPAGLYPLCDETIEIWYKNCTTTWIKVDTEITDTGLITVIGVPGLYKFKWKGVCDDASTIECGPYCARWTSAVYRVDCLTTELPDNFVEAPKTFTKSFFWDVPDHWPAGVYPLCYETIQIWYLNCTQQWVLVDVELTDNNGMITINGVPGTYHFVWPDCTICSWTSIDYLVTCCTSELPDNFVDVPKGGDKDYLFFNSIERSCNFQIRLTTLYQNQSLLGEGCLGDSN